MSSRKRLEQYRFPWPILALPAVVLLLVACGSGPPRLALETTYIDLGQVVNGEVVAREVAVQNTGGGPLVVSSVTTSCGCTQAALEPMELPPGGQGKLTIVFDTGAHGPELTGLLIRQVFLVSNDPNQPEAQVELAADILPRPVTYYSGRV